MQVAAASAFPLQNLGIAGQVALVSIWSIVIAFLLVGCYKQLGIWARACKVALMVLGVSIPSQLSPSASASPCIDSCHLGTMYH
jgi:hypothetical protein